MQKFVWLWLITALSAAAFSVKSEQYSYPKPQGYVDTTKKDTTRKDTVRKELPRIGLQRDTTYRPDTAQQTPKVTIAVADLSHLYVCPQASIVVNFSTEGPFKEENLFHILMTDGAGKFAVVMDSVKSSPVRLTIPADRAGMVLLKVASTQPASESKPTRLNVLPLPHARIDLTDGTSISKIGPGQTAAYRVNLSGAAPWSFKLSDGTTVVNTFVNPYTAIVTAEETINYGVTDVSNSCGSGTTSGQVLVQVSQDTLPVISLKAAPRDGYRVCTGTPFQVNFNATGKFKIGNGFVVQISDSTGQNFRNISELAPESPMMVKTPAMPSGWYKLRVVSTFPTASSDTADIRIAAPASAMLRPDSLQIAEGGSTNLTLDFKGDGPWFYLLSDGSYQADIRTTPHTVRVNPINPSSFTITSAGGYCGVGNFAGKAFVKVKIPETSITTGDLSNMIICANTEITVPFKTTGRFDKLNQFVIQIKDTSGAWVNLPTTRNAEVFKARITPPVLTDTLTTQQIRVVSTAPVVEGKPTTLKVYMPNAAQARVVGGGIIRPSGAARVRISFKNGLPPWSFTLSDGTTVNGTFINPYQMTVSTKSPFSTTSVVRVRRWAARRYG
ncbi:MAG: hypothetical protein MUE30_13560 [Spirosomaceae bacterium]|nr:hypothetical protein [Spirosomataceae bacterium]